MFAFSFQTSRPRNALFACWKPFAAPFLICILNIAVLQVETAMCESPQWFGAAVVRARFHYFTPFIVSRFSIQHAIQRKCHPVSALPHNWPGEPQGQARSGIGGGAGVGVGAGSGSGSGAGVARLRAKAARVVAAYPRNSSRRSGVIVFFTPRLRLPNATAAGFLVVFFINLK